MKPITEELDVKDITPRDTIPSCIMEMPDFLEEAGWKDFSIKMNYSERPKILISAELRRVKKSPLFLYRVSYIESELSEASIINRARKLIELCLRIKETFIKTLPRSYVERDGFIRTHHEMTEASNKGVDEMIAFIDSERSKVRKYEDESVNFDICYFSLFWDSQSVILTQPNLEKLKEGALNVSCHK